MRKRSELRYLIAVLIMASNAPAGCGGSTDSPSHTSGAGAGGNAAGTGSIVCTPVRQLEGGLEECAEGFAKELVAQALHEHSSVNSRPFVAVNCGALDRALARSELFGHRRGAFTGAIDAHGGAFQAACGGTYFSMKSENCPMRCSPFCCERSSEAPYAEWGRLRNARPTCA
jgi:hypothetical protein